MAEIVKHRAGPLQRTLHWTFQRERSTYALSRWLFLRLLGLAYLFAFWSLGTQITGLIGKNGILPAADYMQLAARAFPTAWQRLTHFPTLVWLNTGDDFLRFLCWGGAGLALLLVLDVAPILMLPVLWVFYLSLLMVGQDFLSFQWDTLLLETGFLAIFIAPLSLRPHQPRDDPPRVVRWLLWWLLFRLMVSSGSVKLLSGDPAWANLTALLYHYETQPLPTPIAWYFHLLPAWFHQLSVVMVFIIELGMPFLIFAPWRRARLIGIGALIFLQVLIALTGNYAFFNLLAIALCAPALDDGFLRRFFPKSLLSGVKPKGEHRSKATSPLQPARDFSSITDGYIDAPRKPHEGLIGRTEVASTSTESDDLGAPFNYRRWFKIALALPLLIVVGIPSLTIMAFTYGEGSLVPTPAVDLTRAVAPFQIVSSYGLFAVMTTSRPEIIIEGSDDQVAWKAYEFRYKPGDLQRPPLWVEPFQPRLDWQLWFAALDGYQGTDWFPNFLQRLLQGSPDVLALMGNNPFPDKPPRYIRATVYDYHFTDTQQRSLDGAWWWRDNSRPYAPVTYYHVAVGGIEFTVSEEEYYYGKEFLSPTIPCRFLRLASMKACMR
jgi:hypothetical protein